MNDWLDGGAGTAADFRRQSFPKINIPDFCDMERFEQMMRDWASSTGLATVAVGSDGEYVSSSYNFTDFCYRFTRKSPEGLRRCIACDRKGTGTYLCHAGLVDFAAPITLEDGTVVGKIVGGQVLPEQPDEQKFRMTARELGIDEEAYVEALHKVNIRSREEIRASAALLANTINMFVRMSYAARRDMASLSERARIISSLSKIYFCDYYIDLDRGRYIELDATDELRAFAGPSGEASAMIKNACRFFAEPGVCGRFSRLHGPFHAEVQNGTAPDHRL
jgi:ligand-binding sensor protein